MTSLPESLSPWIAAYQQRLPQLTRDELYKWRAVKVFQENWDIKAPDFPAMLRRSLVETGNLLGSVQYFPKLMIEEFADQFPEEVRAAFGQLFDETIPLEERLPRFKAAAEDWRVRYFVKKSARSHYQDERALSVYLILRYPDHYYLFKPTVYKKFAELVDVPIDKRKRAQTERVLDFMELANEVRDVLAQDSQLVTAHQARLPSNVYPDTTMALVKSLVQRLNEPVIRHYLVHAPHYAAVEPKKCALLAPTNRWR